MSRSRLRGLGLVSATLLAASLTLSTPASAEDATGNIAGTITDNGVPVAFASVDVRSADFSFSTNTFTDESGGYFLSGVPEAVGYIVSVTAPGHPTQWIHGKTSDTEADPVTVTDGQTTVVDEQLLPTGTITGHFRDEAGNPVSAGVQAQRDSDGSGALSSTNFETGEYALHVFAGTYRVSFETGGVTQYAFGTRDFFNAALIPVAVGETVTVDDTKLPTGTFAGRVTYSDGSPAADVSVSLQSDTGSSPGGLTDADGNYTISNVLPGTYNVQFVLTSGATEYAHGKFSRSEADVFTVIANAMTTVDEQLPATATIAGRFTDQAGNGVADVQVVASTTGREDQNILTVTDGNGDYRLDRVFPAQYTIMFQNSEIQLTQFAFGRLSFETADLITVTAGQTATVNDQRLPVGSVRFTAKNSLTGAPINSFFVNLNDRGGQTETGELVVDNLAIGQYTVEAGGAGYAFDHTAATFTVTAGQQTDVVLSLRPVARITTKVVDRKTGQGVAGICVNAATKTNFQIPDGCAGFSDENGNVTVDLDNPGTVNLFVLPERGSVYGAQWVGPTGGTGTQESAAKIAAKSGNTVAAPRIKLDKHGTITGKVTADGPPIVSGIVGIVGQDLGSGSDVRYAAIAADGSYTVDYLGPYEWPLLFGAQNHAYQWSGGVGNRLKAALVPVKAGKTTKFNYRMKVGTDVAITYNLPAPNAGRFSVRNAVTGDIMAVGDTEVLPGTVHVLVIGPQTVKIGCDCNGEQWHGGTDFASATPVSIPATGSKQIIFVVP